MTTDSPGDTMPKPRKDPYDRLSNPLSIRFPGNQWDELKNYHETSGVPYNEIIRRAVAAYLAALRKLKEDV